MYCNEPVHEFPTYEAIVVFHVTNVAPIAMFFRGSLQEGLLDSHLSGAQ